MDGFWSKNLKKLVALLVCVAIIVSTLAIVGYYFPQSRHALSPHKLLQAFNDSHGKLSAADSALIRSWMTFDYVNMLFKLPADYLKEQLSITDVRYPRISISVLAKSEHLDVNTLLLRVQKSVHDYIQQ